MKAKLNFPKSFDPPKTFVPPETSTLPILPLPTAPPVRFVFHELRLFSASECVAVLLF
jgi:hypothetical protein